MRIKKYAVLIVVSALALVAVTGLVRYQTVSAQSLNPSNPAQPDSAAGLSKACNALTNSSKYQSRMLSAYKSAVKKAESDDLITDDEMDAILDNAAVKSFRGCDTQGQLNNGSGGNQINPPAAAPVVTVTPVATPVAPIVNPPVQNPVGNGNGNQANPYHMSPH
jgi:hypothetical protein